VLCDEARSSNPPCLTNPTTPPRPRVHATPTAPGADPNVPDFDGAAPLHTALAAQETELVELLLSSGAECVAFDWRLDCGGRGSVLLEACVGGSGYTSLCGLITYKGQDAHMQLNALAHCFRPPPTATNAASMPRARTCLAPCTRWRRGALCR